MACNIDGLQVGKPTQEIADFIETNISISSFMPWNRQIWPGADLLSTVPFTGYNYDPHRVALTHSNWTWPEPKFKLNVFRWPSGASRWAYGHFLMTAAQLTGQTTNNDGTTVNVLEDAYDSNGNYKPIPFYMDSPGLQSLAQNQNEVINTNVYLLPPTPLSGLRSGTSDANSLYLVTIVDQRYFWWYRNMKTDITISYSNQMNWTDLFDKVSTNLGFDNAHKIKYDSIDSKYLYPSPDFNIPYCPIPPFLDAVAANVGQRIVLDFSGQVYSKNQSKSFENLNKFASQNPYRTVRAGWQRFPSTDQGF